MKNGKRTPAIVQAEIDYLSQLITKALTVYNSTDFECSFLVSGTDSRKGKNNARFNEILKITASDPDAVQFFNNYASTLTAKRLVLHKELELLTENVGEISVWCQGMTDDEAEKAFTTTYYPGSNP